MPPNHPEPKGCQQPVECNPPHFHCPAGPPASASVFCELVHFTLGFAFNGNYTRLGCSQKSSVSLDGFGRFGSEPTFACFEKLGSPICPHDRMVAVALYCAVVRSSSLFPAFIGIIQNGVCQTCLKDIGVHSEEVITQRST